MAIEFSITIVIIAITVIASFFAFNNREKLGQWMMNPYAVVHYKDYKRLLTHGLIHGDMMHLFFNVFVLHQFGSSVEMVFTNESAFNVVFGMQNWWGSGMGISMFLMLYIGAIFAATIPSIIKHKDNPGYNSLGASGAVSAVLIVYILIQPTASLTLLIFPFFPIPAWVMGILFFVFEAYMNKRGGTGIAHDAHIYGAIYGLLFMTVVQPSVWTWFFGTLFGG
ncbi:MAG: rhomboid family intramembrane serine protease [Flavobacteriales bacterium]|nr:rhomboid family intramembrane serine protease [Flavobacteriales bacterium]